VLELLTRAVVALEQIAVALDKLVTLKLRAQARR
jgi:hypothetical protein